MVVDYKTTSDLAALRTLEEWHGFTSVRYPGHILQLVVNHALKEAQIKRHSGMPCRIFQEEWAGQLQAESKAATKEAHSTILHDRSPAEQRWPVTASLSDSEVTQQGKRFLDLKGDQWNLLEELEQVLKPFECATVYQSGEACVCSLFLLYLCWWMASKCPYIAHHLRQCLSRLSMLLQHMRWLKYGCWRPQSEMMHKMYAMQLTWPKISQTKVPASRGDLKSSSQSSSSCTTSKNKG